jgi:hypothetical protein
MRKVSRDRFHVIASAAKQSPTPGIEIASPAPDLDRRRGAPRARREAGTGGNKANSGKISSLKFQVSSGESPAAGGLRDVLYKQSQSTGGRDTLLLQDAIIPGFQSDAGGTNKTPASNKANFRRSFKFEVGSAKWRAHSPHETPGGGGRRWDRPCETKPISEGGSGFEFQVSSEESHASSPPTSNFKLETSNSAEGQACETKPIGGGACRVEQSQSAGGQNTPLFQYSIIPGFQSRACRAKQSQFPIFRPTRWIWNMSLRVAKPLRGG